MEFEENKNWRNYLKAHERVKTEYSGVIYRVWEACAHQLIFYKAENNTIYITKR